MSSPPDRAALDAAWLTWLDRAAPPPPSLQAFVDSLREAADRDVRAVSSAADRAHAIAWQVELDVAHRRLRNAGPGFATWQTLAKLAHAAGGDARAELLGLAIEAGGGAGSLEPACLAALAPLLEPATVRAWALAALSAPGLDAGDQGLLLGVLPEEDVAALLPPLLEQAVAIVDYGDRWSAIGDLTEKLPERWEQRAAERSRALHGVEVEEWYRLSDDAIDDALEQAQADLERRSWGAPLTAWHLGSRASRLPAAERGPVLDRAIDEYAAIALTPVSPGNDEGPFWAMAWMLDEAQVRRALGVVERMEGADWQGDLGASRAALIARLALLGHADEAAGMIPRIGTTDPFAASWRAHAWGGVLGARLSLDPAARFEALLAGTADDPDHHDPEWRFRLMEATSHVFADRPPPDAADVEALIDVARALEPRRRQIALQDLMGHVLRALPVQRWLSVTLAECEGQGLVEALIALAEASRDAGLDPRPALRPLLAILDERPCAEPVWTFRDLCDLRAWIAPEEAIARWADFLRHAAAGDAWHAVHDVEAELPEILAWLAGPEAWLPVGRALARALQRR